jgi:deoxyribose-phosphate aldolase
MKKLNIFLDKFHKKIDEKEISDRISSLKKIEEEGKEKLEGIKSLASFLDLTSLEGSDTKDKIVNMCNKAIRPIENEPEFPHCAAVCVYPNLIKYAKKAVKGSGVKIATVATAFPSGQFPLKLKLADVKYCIEEGADEIDMVISRGEFLMGNFQYVYDEIKKVKKICTSIKPKKNIHLKVILETGELESLDNVRKASLIAIKAGADFIKTSTGKIPQAATLPVTFVMSEAINDFYLETGNKVGIKAAGGIRTTNEAFEYMRLIKNVLGTDWLNQNLFRIGASSLLNDLIAEYKKQ